MRTFVHPTPDALRGLRAYALPGSGRVPPRAWATVALALLTATRAAPAADQVHWTITGQTSVTFDWRGPESAIRYGKYPQAMVDSVVAVTPSPTPDSSPGPFREARITGLQENTYYYYRIGNAANAKFRTPPPRGSSDFWFAEQADVGSSLSWPNVAVAQGMILEDNEAVPGIDHPRFVLMAGDLTYGDQNSVADVDQHFNDVMAWSRIVAYMPAWGNHEWGTAADAEPDNLNNYEGRFDLPNSQTVAGASIAVGNGPGEDWYWFDYGNVRFISFPEPFDGTWNEWASQVAPVMQEAEADPAITFIVTFGHRPSWSSGADHGGEPSLANLMATLKNACSKYVMSLQAHSHHYERSLPALTGGIQFVVGSGGGSSVGGLSASAPAWSAFRMNHLVHLRFHVQEDRIDAYAICGPDGAGSNVSCVQGSVIDSWTVLAPALVAVPDAPAPARGIRLSAEPNPARGSVVLRIDVDAAGEQTLEVLDLAGRLVRELSSGWQPEGVRRVAWDGTVRSGALAPAGIYLVRVRSGERSTQVRVSLLR